MSRINRAAFIPFMQQRLRVYLETLYRFLSAHRWLLIALLLGILIPLIIFGILVERVREAGGLTFDITTLHFIHQYATPGMDALIVFATRLGAILALPGLAVIVLGLRLLRQPTGAVFFTVAVAGAWSINIMAKILFQRARPALWLSPAPEQDYSFPSGHAMLSVAIAGSLIALAWPTRLRWPALIGGTMSVVGIGLSRLYLGVHFPSDIMAGWCAALLWVTGVYLIVGTRERRLPEP